VSPEEIAASERRRLVAERVTNGVLA